MAQKCQNEPKYTFSVLTTLHNAHMASGGPQGPNFGQMNMEGGLKSKNNSIFDVKRPLQIYLVKNTFTFKGLHNFSFPKHVCQIVGRNINLICFALKGGWCLNHLSALPPWLLELTSPSKAFTGKYVDRH